MNKFGIRPYQPSDVDEVHAAAKESRGHVARWMGWLTPDYSLADARAWVSQAVDSREKGESYEYLIIDFLDGSIVGSCGLNLINQANGFCNLGYWVRSSRLGEGAAREATLLLRDFGFQVLKLNRLEIVVADGNAHSRAVAESVGAIYEGLLRMRLMVGETVHDAHIYALLNPATKVASEQSQVS